MFFETRGAKMDRLIKRNHHACAILFKANSYKRLVRNADLIDILAEIRKDAKKIIGETQAELDTM